MCNIAGRSGHQRCFITLLGRTCEAGRAQVKATLGVASPVINVAGQLLFSTKC